MKKEKKGFVLMEMLIAIFVFALIITSVVGVFVSSYKSQESTQEKQRDLENVRIAMETMAKNIRTSSLDYPSSVGGSREIYIYDYSQEKCIGYKFSDTGSGTRTLEFKELDISRLDTSDSSIINCRTELSSVSFSDFLSDTELADGRFIVRKTLQETSESANDGYMGKVTIVMRIENEKFPFETSVSLRDY